MSTAAAHPDYIGYTVEHSFDPADISLDRLCHNVWWWAVKDRDEKGRDQLKRWLDEPLEWEKRQGPSEETRKEEMAMFLKARTGVKGG